MQGRAVPLRSRLHTRQPSHACPQFHGHALSDVANITLALELNAGRPILLSPAEGYDVATSAATQG